MNLFNLNYLLKTLCLDTVFLGVEELQDLIWRDTIQSTALGNAAVCHAHSAVQQKGQEMDLRATGQGQAHSPQCHNVGVVILTLQIKRQRQVK